MGRSAPHFRCDVSSVDDVESLRAQVVSELGTPTILVNAAGIFGPLERISRVDPRAWSHTIAVDALGPFFTCNAFAGGMIERGWGRIVNVSSAASLHSPGPVASAYATAKAALNHLTRHLAAELAGSGVTANVIHPGDVKTEMWAEIRAAARELGQIAAPYTQWADWVEETGGDPTSKVVKLLLRIIEDDVNGQFLWLDDPLQPPRASWDLDEALRLPRP